MFHQVIHILIDFMILARAAAYCTCFLARIVQEVFPDILRT